MQPIIEKNEKGQLLRLAKKLDGSRLRQEADLLLRELKRAKVVEAEALPANTVRLYSTVEVSILTDQRQMRFTIVMPEEADMAEKKISVFAPMAVALIGFQSGMVVDWHMGNGKKRLRIDSVESAA